MVALPVPRLHPLLTLLLLTILPGLVRAQPGVPQGDLVVTQPPEPLPGTVVICGGGPLPDEVRDTFVKLAGGNTARLVIIPTASASADKSETFPEPWQKYKLASITVLHAKTREEANKGTFLEPLTRASAVWLSGGVQSRLSEAYNGTGLLNELKKLLQRGGVVGGTSAGAAALSQVMIAGGNPHPGLAAGLGLLPHVLIDQHFLKRDRVNRLLAGLEKTPGLFGLGVDEETAVILKGRSLTVIGKSYAVICQAPSPNRPASIQILKPGDRADYIALSRAALARAETPRLPPGWKRKTPDPIVSRGTLVIVGGGGMPPGLWQRFIDLAGGPEARIVVIPTALGEPFPAEPGEIKALRKYGAKNLKVLHARTPRDADDEKFLAELRQAKGLWFSGGRQWRLVDSYLDTKAHQEMHAILERGGVIGGSSAGASIQADYMVRGDPLGNLKMMAEGYERGLGFLPGAAVDQHFLKRKRTADMTELMAVHPDLLGIGIDEATAIVVQGEVFEVVGVSKVAIYDRRRPILEGQPDYLTLTAGQKFNLVKRVVVK